MDLNDLFRKPDDADFEENDEKEELDNIIVLNDEDGNEVEFEFLDIVECDGCVRQVKSDAKGHLKS